MVNLEAGTINLGDKEWPITSFEVWFRIPVGLTKSRSAAVERCRELDFDPRMCIIAVAVAVTAEPSVYEELSCR